MDNSQFRLAFVAFWFALAAALFCADARATTIIPMSDADLALSSRAIVEGRVLSIDVQANAERTAVYTFVSFRVTRVIKGDVVRGQTIVLKQLGGRVGEDATQLFGLPFFAPKWRMLLFLNTDPEGAFRVAHVSLGYFRLLRVQGSKVDYVSRPTFGASVVAGSNANGRITNFGPRDAFVSRVRRILSERSDEAAKYQRERWRVPVRPVPLDYVPGANGGGKVNFTFLEPGIRWTEPDTGDEIKFVVNPEGAPTPSGGYDEAEAVANAWSTIPGSSLRVSIGPNATAKCGFRMDGATAISFGDCEEEIDDPVNCTGVVAIGGVSAAVTNETSTVGGETFYRAIEGDVVFNDGFECLTSDTSLVEEMLTHELGHALGFGHSSATPGEPNPILSDAVMYYAAHNDGRGASIRQDDEDAVRFLYRAEGDGKDLAITTDALPDAPVGVAYEFALEATGSGPFTWSIDFGDLPAGLSLSASGVLSGTAAADAEAAVTFSVRDSANFVQTRTLELKATANPAPFLLSGKYEDSKLTLTGLNLGADTLVTVNDVQIAPPTPVKFKSEKGKLTLNGSAADLNFRKNEPNTARVVFDGRTSNTLRF